MAKTWWEKLLRAEGGISLGQWLYDKATWLLPLVGVTGVTAALSYVTDWLSALGPAGIWAFALGCGVLVAIALSTTKYLAAGAALKRAHVEAVEKWRQVIDDSNPLAPEFHKQRLSLSRLAHPVTNRIVGKRFTDCELMGPANIALARGLASGVLFGNCDVIASRDDAVLYNVIVLDNCHIVGGPVWRCTVYVPQSMTHELTQNMKGVNFVTLTGNPEIDDQAQPSPAVRKPQ